jgi:hypothetical protein
MVAPPPTRPPAADATNVAAAAAVQINGLPEVSSRPVGLLQPLVLGWCSLAAAGLLPKGLTAARGALQTILGNFDASHITSGCGDLIAALLCLLVRMSAGLLGPASLPARRLCPSEPLQWWPFLPLLHGPPFSVHPPDYLSSTSASPPPAPNTLRRLLWELINAWCWDIAAALAAHGTNVDPAVQVRREQPSPQACACMQPRRFTGCCLAATAPLP